MRPISEQRDDNEDSVNPGVHMPSSQTNGAPTCTTTKERLAAWLAPVAAVLVFLPTLWYGFVWDDRYSIVTNKSLNSWATLAQSLWGPVDPTVSMYRPVVGTMLFFQFQLFGLHPWGYHLTSVLLHAVACALAFRFVLLLSGQRPVAVFASLLFAVHAVHLEAVAWVSAFAEPLVVAAILAGFIAYLLYRQDMRRKWLVAICLSLFLGLLTKETAIVLPMLLLAYEFTLGNSQSRNLKRNLPLIAALSSTVLVYIAMRHFAYTGFVYNESRMPFHILFFTWPSLLVIYCKHLLLPTELSPFYDSSYVLAANASFWLPMLVLIALAAAVYLGSKRLANGPLIRFCTLGMVISIIPCLDLNIFQFREIMHDRFLYLPSLFFATLLGQLLFGARESKDTRDVSGNRPPTMVYAVLGASFILLNISALLVQSPAWRSDEVLLSHAVRLAPGNPRPAFTLAEEYLERGDMVQAEQMLQHVVQLVPAPKAFALLGQTRLRMGNPRGAEEPLRKAIAAAPLRPGQHFALGQCLQALGRSDEASAEFKAELAIRPNYRESASQDLQPAAAKP
jgi:hypothetical protein